MAVEGHRDLLSQLLAQRHPCGRGQLPAIGKHCAAEDGAPRGIQGPTGVTEIRILTIISCQAVDAIETNTDVGQSAFIYPSVGGITSKLFDGL